MPKSLTPNLSYLSALMVASDQCNSVRIPNLQKLVHYTAPHSGMLRVNLECQQEEKGFHTVEPSVYKVSQEEVVCFRDISPNLEEFFEVIVLSVNISADLGVYIDSTGNGVKNEILP